MLAQVLQGVIDAVFKREFAAEYRRNFEGQIVCSFFFRMQPNAQFGYFRLGLCFVYSWYGSITHPILSAVL
jgi:hypothetical protein